MPRGAPSLADERLIAALADDDVYVSAFQLERWRRQRQLPRPARHGLGRGRGSESSYPEITLETARTLAKEAWQGRSRHYGTFATFAAGCFGHPCFYDEAAVREAFVWALERIEHFKEKKRARDPEAVDKLADEIARRVKPYDPVLWHLADAEHPSKREAKIRAQARRELSSVRGMRAMLVLDDPSQFNADFAADAMGFSGWPVEELRKYFIACESASDGELFPAGSPTMLQLMIEWAHEVDFERLERARDAFLGAGAANMLLLICSGITESSRRFLIELRNSDFGRPFAEVFYAPNRPEQMVFGSLQTSMDETYLEAMHTYAGELMLQLLPFLIETQARAMLTVGTEDVATIGRNLFEMAIHARVDHDNEHWHSASFRNTMAELLAAMKGVGAAQADPYNVIERLWVDFNEPASA